MFHTIKTGSLEYLTADSLSGSVHCFSTRFGGVSEGHLASLNLGTHRGDVPENVYENYRILGAAVGFAPEQTVFTKQEHTDIIRRVGRADCGTGLLREQTVVCDGLITIDPGVALCCFGADCTTILLFDPVTGALGAVHSGWRGTVGKIGKVTVETMTREFGSDPKDILAAVGPSICQDCYEVSEEVIGLFRENFVEELWPKLFYGKENGHYQLNLWEANRLIFEEAGILPEHITVTDVCTACNPELLFSHRASGGKRGNLAGFLGLRA